MKKKIAIISASGPDNQNTGMLSVDFAAYAMLREIPNVELTWFTFPRFQQQGTNDFYTAVKEFVNFKELPRAIDEVYSHDLILFWGDFLNSSSFLNRSGPIQLRTLGLTESEVRNELLRCLLLRDAPDSVLRKTILFGGSLLSDDQADMDDIQYKKSFERLVRCSRNVFMRDPISAARCTLIRGKHEQDCMGVDAALLLPKELELPTTAWSDRPNNKTIGLFVGSRSTLDASFFNLITQLQKSFAARVDWLPWLPQTGAPRRTKASRIKGLAKRLAPSRGVRLKERDWTLAQSSREVVTKLKRRFLRKGTCGTGDLLRQLSHYEFVVTDTYHVCVNAWRLGVPAFCFYDSSSKPYEDRGTIGEMKKIVLYSQYMANGFIFSTGQSQYPQLPSKILNTFDSSQAKNIAIRIENHTAQVKVKLLQSINSHLESCVN